VAYPPVVDLSAKIVEVAEKGHRSYRAKRGGLGGRKEVFRSPGFRDRVVLAGSAGPRGSGKLLKPLIENGKIVRRYEGIETLRSRLLSHLKEVETAQPSLTWM
jgi:nicotinate phosphoribosyltransferase